MRFTGAQLRAIARLARADVNTAAIQSKGGGYGPVTVITHSAYDGEQRYNVTTRGVITRATAPELNIYNRG
jgi:hypothetical protein